MVGDEPLSSAESTGRRDGHERIEAIVHARHGSSIAAILEREPAWARDFNDLTYEARRLFGEVFGTFLLVLAGAGAAIVEVVTHGHIGRDAAVTAPAPTVLVVILFIASRTGTPEGRHGLPHHRIDTRTGNAQRHHALPADR